MYVSGVSIHGATAVSIHSPIREERRSDTKETFDSIVEKEASRARSFVPDETIAAKQAFYS